MTVTSRESSWRFQPLRTCSSCIDQQRYACAGTYLALYTGYLHQSPKQGDACGKKFSGDGPQICSRVDLSRMTDAWRPKHPTDPDDVQFLGSCRMLASSARLQPPGGFGLAHLMPQPIRWNPIAHRRRSACVPNVCRHRLWVGTPLIQHRRRRRTRGLPHRLELVQVGSVVEARSVVRADA